jgi:hypothetical protein
VEGEEESVLEAARAIRAYLPDLVGDEAPEVDRQVSELFEAQSSGEEITERLVELLSARSATREWAARLIGDERLLPPEVSALMDRGLSRPPGPPGVINAARYVCPEGDYVWYRLSVSEPVGSCPSHGAVLEPG